MNKKKTSKKSEQCEQFCSILPVCILVSILTAVLVTLVFSVAFARTIRPETAVSYDVSGAFKEAIEQDNKDVNDFTLIGSKAVVDFMTTKHSGFIYASTSSCSECTEFDNLLKKAKEGYEITDIYHYNYDDYSDTTTDVDRAAKDATLAEETAPVFLYIKDGIVYDRLDDVKSESDLVTFINKYK